MSKIITDKDGNQYIFVRYITRNGVRIYPKNARVFRIKIK